MAELIDGKTVLYVGVLAVIIILVGLVAYSYFSLPSAPVKDGVGINDAECSVGIRGGDLQVTNEGNRDDAVYIITVTSYNERNVKLDIHSYRMPQVSSRETSAVTLRFPFGTTRYEIVGVQAVIGSAKYDVYYLMDGEVRS